MTTKKISDPRSTYITSYHDGARTQGDTRISLSVVGEDIELMKKMIDFWEFGKPTPPIDEFHAFYSDLTEDIRPTLCETCKGLEIDDSSFGGIVRPCSHTDGCQHLSFQDLPRNVYQGAQFMSLPVQFARKDNLPELPSLTTSADDGCQFCSLLISTLRNRNLTKHSTISISNAQYEWHTDPNRNQVEERSCLSDGSLHLFSLRVQMDSDQPFKLWFKISAPPLTSTLWLRIPRQPPLEYPSPDDGDGRFTFKLWFDEHIKACKGCQNPPRNIPTQTQHPTRLIDVGASSAQGGADKQEPRLIITKDHPQIFNPVDQEPPKYLALSYCWGKDPPTTHLTTNDTLEKRCQHIPLDDFPPACRDAVNVTRSLGFRYLWIDACCIIQGNAEDWEQESRKLTDIYGNAFLTIIPLSSGSSSEGFLPARSKSARIHFQSTLKEHALGSYWIHEVPNASSEEYDPKDFQRRLELTWPPPDRQSADEELKESQWVTRGWTFNEALMSPRKLKFGSRAVEFECYGLGFVERALKRCIPGTDLLENHLWVQFMDQRGNARDIIGRYWTASQFHISHRKFTDPTDRLPAISSFAELVIKRIEDSKKIKKAKDVKETEDDKQTRDDKKIGDDYIAGLFRPELHRGLTWNKKMEHKGNGFTDHLDMSFFRHGAEFYNSHCRPGEEPKDCYVAPSWSWISTPSSSYSEHAWGIATIVDANCDIETEVQLENKHNPFGRVKSGHIVLTSKAYHSDSMRLYMQEEKLRLKDDAGLEAEMDLDWKLQLGQDEDLMISNCRWDENHPLWKSQGPLSGMHLVPLIQEEDGRETIGLIIIPFPNQPDEIYMRAGIFMSTGTWNPPEDCPRKSLRVS